MALLFIKKQHPEETQPLAAVTQQEQQRGGQAQASVMEKLEVHTMPDKFMNLKRESAGGGLKKHILLGVIVVIILGGVMGFAAWLFIRSITPASPKVVQEQQNIPPPMPPAVTTPPGSNIATVTPTSTPVLPPPLIPTPTSTATGSVEGGENGNGQQVPTSTGEITPLPPPVSAGPRLSMLPSSRDSDGDQLTDIEEGLWGTNPLRPDSDGDGYGDGSELVALFDPAQGGGAKLESSPALRTYLNPQLRYTVLVPVSWENRLLDPESATQVIFVSATGEFIGISAQENFEGFQDPKDWYRFDYPSVPTTLLQEISSQSLTGVYSPDGLAAYFIDGGYLFAISYNPGLRETVNFQTTFRMIIQSFRTFVRPDENIEGGQEMN